MFPPKVGVGMEQRERGGGEERETDMSRTRSSPGLRRELTIASAAVITVGV